MKLSLQSRLQTAFNQVSHTTSEWTDKRIETGGYKHSLRTSSCARMASKRTVFHCLLASSAVANIVRKSPWKPHRVHVPKQSYASTPPIFSKPANKTPRQQSCLATGHCQCYAQRPFFHITQKRVPTRLRVKCCKATQFQTH
mgnify:CR=1 FL=1